MIFKDDVAPASDSSRIPEDPAPSDLFPTTGDPKQPQAEPIKVAEDVNFENSFILFIFQLMRSDSGICPGRTTVISDNYPLVIHIVRSPPLFRV